MKFFMSLHNSYCVVAFMFFQAFLKSGFGLRFKGNKKMNTTN